MRLIVRYALVVAAVGCSLGKSARANPIEFLDRIVGFAEEAFEDTLEQTGATPNGPPPFRVGLMLPKSGSAAKPPRASPVAGK